MMTETNLDPLLDLEEKIIKEALMILARRVLKSDGVLHDPEAVKQYLIMKLDEFEKEGMAVLFLDSQNIAVAFEDLFLDSASAGTISPRDIARAAFKHNADRVVLYHSHSRGNAKPSEAETKATEAIRLSLAAIDVVLVDYVMIGQEQTFSFAEHGWLGVSLTSQ